MTLVVDFRQPDATAVLTKGPSLPAAAWDVLAKAARDLDPQAIVRHDRIEIGWGRFLLLTRAIVHAQSRFNFQPTYSSGVRQRLDAYVSEVREVARVREETAQQVARVTAPGLRGRLNDRGWDFTKRELTDQQERDALKILNLAHGANFSVPGAGKTTVAIAVHLAAMPDSAALLVVAPKNAFPAWDEAITDCLRDHSLHFVRLQGGRDAVRLLLTQTPTFAIITYGQLVRVMDLMTQFFARHDVHLVLDESHRIKAGRDSLTGDTALALAPLAVRRDILSGTPLPNDVTDLSPQFDFLWPAQGLGSQIESGGAASQIVGPLYARTTKSELNLPEPIVCYEAVDMSDAQRVLYGLLRDDALRQLRGIATLLPGVRVAVMRLLQAAIDPQAAVQSLIRAGGIQNHSNDDFRDICQIVMDEAISPRMAIVERHARSLAAEGRKVVIWSPFLYSIEELVRRLDDLGTLAIHGGVQAGDERDDDTREGILRLFHSDPSRMVLVANPAAGGEGISLHHICHDAIYLGRTYNAAHYLQSRDRIHRLGLPPDAETRITIYECRAPTRLGSIDLSVRRRLDFKVLTMSAALNDLDLRQLALESLSADPGLDDGLSFEDLRDLFQELEIGSGATN